mgnify:CR=1 FL=1|jgi:hypothetical protein|tara:strand:- start:119 stop:424 length:306 start_codon:yes stop_codon:yes gene_type:complete
MKEQTPVRLSVENELIDILREYKSMRASIRGHWQLEGILNHSEENIDDLIQKLGLCYGDYAPFQLFIHPSDNYQTEYIAKYIHLMQSKCTDPEEHECLDES